MNHKLIFCSILLTIVFASGCNGPYTKITIVRHAEKVVGGGTNPPLTAAGNARALELRDRHASTPIAAVYSTNFNRTRQTAQPLADTKGLPVTIYATPAEVAAAIMNDHIGEYVAIVGHSNTVGNIILALGADLPDGFINPIDELDYDNFILVLVDNDGVASAAHTTYGATSP